jgi:hypothetical protein
MRRSAESTGSVSVMRACVPPSRAFPSFESYQAAKNPPLLARGDKLTSARPMSAIGTFPTSNLHWCGTTENIGPAKRLRWTPPAVRARRCLRGFRCTRPTFRSANHLINQNWLDQPKKLAFKMIVLTIDSNRVLAALGWGAGYTMNRYPDPSAHAWGRWENRLTH